MNIEIGDKLDLLIAFSANDCGNDDVEMFRNLDTSDVTLSNEFYARLRRLINRYKRKPTLTLTRKFLVRVAVALMAIMSIGFLTAMAIPNVRNAIFDSPTAARRTVSAVFQNFGKYDATLRHNITVSDPTRKEADEDAELWKLCELTGFAECVRQQAHGFDEEIGDFAKRGNDLSGGAVAEARAHACALAQQGAHHGAR